jgi:hypothetical protein
MAPHRLLILITDTVVCIAKSTACSLCTILFYVLPCSCLCCEADKESPYAEWRRQGRGYEGGTGRTYRGMYVQTLQNTMANIRCSHPRTRSRRSSSQSLPRREFSMSRISRLILPYSLRLSSSYCIRPLMMPKVSSLLASERSTPTPQKSSCAILPQMHPIISSECSGDKFRVWKGRLGKPDLS